MLFVFDEQGTFQHRAQEWDPNLLKEMYYGHAPLFFKKALL